MSESECTHIGKLKDTESYTMWDFEIKVLLKSKGLMDIVDGTETLEQQDNDGKKVKLWKAMDAKAQYIILMTIEQAVKMHIVSCENSKQMYDMLKSIYQMDTTQQKCSLLQEFYNFKYDQQKDMMGNIAYIQNLAFKLNKLEQKVDDIMIVTKILSVLPENYKHFSSAWDSTSSTDKTLENLKARLIQEEAKTSNNSEQVAFKTFHQGRPDSNHFQSQVKYNRPNNQKFCTYCKKPNHFESECFKKNKTQSKSKDHCKICKKTNHVEKNCFFRKTKSNEESKPKTSFLTCETPNVNLCKANRPSPNNVKSFVVDSGCTPNHMTNDLSILENVKENNKNISVAKKNLCMQQIAVGDVGADQCNLMNVSYVPELRTNLMSVNAITENNGEVLFSKDKVQIMKNDTVVLEGYKNNNGLYVVQLTDNQNEKVAAISRVETIENKPNVCETNTAQVGQDVPNQKLSNVKSNASPITQKPKTKLTNEMYSEWHRKLGHISLPYLKKLSKMCDGLPADINLCEDILCDICLKAKQVRLPFNTSREKANRPLKLIHSDICGPIEVLTHDSKKYFLTVIDDFTHFCKVYLLSNKSEVFMFLKEYIVEAEAHFNLKVAKIRCDNGGEYIANGLKQYCKMKGIVIDYTIPYSPQLNGTAERMNRTLLEKARAMLFDSNLSKEMWGEAILTSAYLINRSPTTSQDVTPAERWYNRKPDLAKLQIFGSVAYAKVLGYVKKLDERSKEAIFVGYTTNGYRLWDPLKRKTFVSRDVIFKAVNSSRSEQRPEKLFNEHKTLDEEDVETEVEENQTNIDQEENQQDVNPENPIAEEVEEDFLGWQDETEEIENERRYNLRPRTNMKRPLRYDDNFENGQVLLTYNECMTGSDKEKWQEAVDKEKQSLDKNLTWELVDENQIKGEEEILTSRWVFKVKDNGTYKARLVIRGCEQKKGNLDFQDTFSPVVESASLRILFSLAAQENLHIQTFDVKTAFLYGEIEQNIYMKIPEGFADQGKICKLNKALYGLKQAPSQWNKKLTSFLKSEGLIQLKTDQCLFKDTKNDLYLAIHVDDGILMGKNPKQMKNLLEKLRDNFEMTCEENPSMYVGMEITKKQEGIYLSQSKYADQILKNFNMSDCKPVSTPITEQTKDIESGKPNFPYREAIGSLLYMTNKTRPDMTYAVNFESRFMENPEKKDVQNVKRTLRYLKGTKGKGIFFPATRSKDISIQAYCDSDYAGDTNDRKSTSGYILLFGKSPIVWSSKKQPIIALSTAEAEYISAAECCKEIKYVKTLISELTEKVVNTTLHVDNQSAIKLIKSGQMNRKSKHIDVRFHYVSEQFQDKLFDLKYCCSEDQLADVFTKPLSSTKFVKFSSQLLKHV